MYFIRGAIEAAIQSVARFILQNACMNCPGRSGIGGGVGGTAVICHRASVT